MSALGFKCLSESRSIQGEPLETTKEGKLTCKRWMQQSVRKASEVGKRTEELVGGRVFV